ncbi:unnamed protein product, partial [Ectocarpus sp. 12 AP-2014]
MGTFCHHAPSFLAISTSNHDGTSARSPGTTCPSAVKTMSWFAASSRTESSVWAVLGRGLKSRLALPLPSPGDGDATAAVGAPGSPGASAEAAARSPVVVRAHSP